MNVGEVVVVAKGQRDGRSACFVQNYVDRDPSTGALDYRCGHRTYDKHDGTDIRLLDMAAQKSGVRDW